MAPVHPLRPLRAFRRAERLHLMNGWIGPIALLVFVGCASGPPRFKSDFARADAIVVLGNRPPIDESGRVMPETRRRVTKGAKLFARGLAPVLLMTGGRDPSGNVESEVMRDLAVRLGVPKHQIIVERNSTDTITNARNSIQLLCHRRRLRSCSVIVVSSPFHLTRAAELFRCAGAHEVQLAPTEIPTSAAYARSFAAYEAFVATMYAFIDECALAKGQREDYGGILNAPP